MMWVLMSAIALLVGIAMFAKVQPDIPDELSFLKGKPDEALVADSGSAATSENLVSLPGFAAAEGWTLVMDGENRELSHDFAEYIVGPGGQRYDKPTLYLTCYEGNFYTRINTRISVEGKNPFTLDFSGAPAWNKTENQNWYSANGHALATLLAARQNVTVQMRFTEAGQQRFTLDTSGLAIAAKKLAPCKL